MTILEQVTKVRDLLKKYMDAGGVKYSTRGNHNNSIVLVSPIPREYSNELYELKKALDLADRVEDRMTIDVTIRSLREVVNSMGRLHKLLNPTIHDGDFSGSIDRSVESTQVNLNFVNNQAKKMNEKLSGDLAMIETLHKEETERQKTMDVHARLRRIIENKGK